MRWTITSRRCEPALLSASEAPLSAWSSLDQVACCAVRGHRCLRPRDRTSCDQAAGAGARPTAAQPASRSRASATHAQRFRASASQPRADAFLLPIALTLPPTRLGSQKSRYRAFGVRTVSTVVLITSFILIIYWGHIPLVLMIFALQVGRHLRPGMALLVCAALPPQGAARPRPPSTARPG
jgi:hypothetical protein